MLRVTGAAPAVAEAGCDSDAYDARVTGLDPEIKAPTTIANFPATRDPAMDMVLNDIAPRARSAGTQ